jgi:hypothetical protein
MELQHSDSDDGTEDETETVEFSNVMQEALPRPDADVTLGVIKAELHDTHTRTAGHNGDYEIALMTAQYKLAKEMNARDEHESIMVDLTHGELIAIHSAYGTQADGVDRRMQNQMRLPHPAEVFGD